MAGQGQGNWDDLYSIVRSCTSNYKTNTKNQLGPQNQQVTIITNQKNDQYYGKESQSLSSLQDSYKPFLPGNCYCINTPPNYNNITTTTTTSTVPSTITYINSGFSQGQPPPLIIRQQPPPPPPPVTCNNNTDFGPPPPPPHLAEPRSRKKSRSQQRKRVVELPADDLSSDMWAWRKYGQKPIKGSPFPRSYYRCSSSRGCPARKHVERRRDNPDLFIVSFSGDHTHPPPSHRNSLAGTSRLKLYPYSAGAVTGTYTVNSHPAGGGNDTAGATSADSQSSNDNANCGKGGTGDIDDEVESDSTLIPNMTLNGDIFGGFQRLAGGGGASG